MAFLFLFRWWMDSNQQVFCGLSDAFDGSLSLSTALGAQLQGAHVFLCHMPIFCPETVLNVRPGPCCGTWGKGQKEVLAMAQWLMPQMGQIKN